MKLFSSYNLSSVRYEILTQSLSIGNPGLSSLLIVVEERNYKDIIHNNDMNGPSRANHNFIDFGSWVRERRVETVHPAVTVFLFAVGKWPGQESQDHVECNHWLLYLEQVTRMLHTSPFIHLTSNGTIFRFCWNILSCSRDSGHLFSYWPFWIVQCSKLSILSSSTKEDDCYLQVTIIIDSSLFQVLDRLLIEDSSWGESEPSIKSLKKLFRRSWA